MRGGLLCSGSIWRGDFPTDLTDSHRFFIMIFTLDFLYDFHLGFLAKGILKNDSLK